MLVILAELAPTHQATVKPLRQALTVQFQASCFLACTAISYAHWKARLQSDAVWTTLRCTW